MNICFQKTHQRAFGTFPLKGEVLIKAIEAAAAAGYRAYDTAQMYGNESETGEALAATGLSRDALCLTTKVHPDNFREARFLPYLRAQLTPAAVRGRIGDVPRLRERCLVVRRERLELCPEPGRIIHKAALLFKRGLNQFVPCRLPHESDAVREGDCADRQVT